MKEYSSEYKKELKTDYENLKVFYNQVMKRAGDGPYNDEELCIIRDFRDVCKEYEEVFENKPPHKASFLNKIHEKRKLPASKREPVYCDSCVADKRTIDWSQYEIIGGVSDE